MGKPNDNSMQELELTRLRKMRFPIGGLIIVFVAILSSLSLFSLNRALTQEIKHVRDGFDGNIRIAVETLVSSLEVNRKMFLDGYISEETAMETAKKMVRDARYNSAPDKKGDGYFFADTAKGFCVAHYNPANEGTMRWDLQDKEGTYLIRNFIAKGNEGGGYSEFYFGKMGDEGGSHLKRGYTLKYEPYGWYVTTGNYYEDIDQIVAGIERIRVQDFIVTIFVSLIISIVGLLLMREQKKMEKKNTHHSDLIEITNKVASALLAPVNEDNFEESLIECMSLIGRYTNVDRIQIWQNEMVDDALSYTLRHDWASNEESDNILIPIGTRLKYSAAWKEIFQRNGIINGPVSELQPEDREAMESIGLKSTLTLPLYSRGEFWGLACIDDCRRERVFTDDEVNMLRSAGLMLVNSITRHEQSIQLSNMNEQLTDALERATVASKAKGDFLSNMSHEMRTPMNAIIGMAFIGKKANDIERKDNALHKIEDASAHLLGIINDVLDMAKIEANKLELMHIEFDFEHMLQNALTFIQFRVDEKQLRLTKNVDSAIPRFLVGDSHHLAQVITNLLSNAVKFTHEGGEIRLAAALINETEGECELRIEVADSGIGISQEQQEKLFSPFEQAESGISRQYGGTGLGLVISKSIVEHMGGKIWIESEIGKGARFIFTMKAKRGDKSPTETEGMSDGINADNADGVGEFGGKKLLVVEDVEINREILLALLEDTGLEIDCAVNGKEAVMMIEASPERYDIVFMDMQMPVMDGQEASRRIRALPESRRGRLPIIAMTANVFKSDVDACFAAGMDDHLGKPIDFDKVLEKLRKYLGKRK
ncbi:MAG: cache domain-containing protein [Desulfobulbus sp.]|nr:cache domain-containing protein [Desulfobulbus sp.]